VVILVCGVCLCMYINIIIIVVFVSVHIFDVLISL